MDRKLIEAITEAFIQSEYEHDNPLEPYSYYEEKAKTAVVAYEEYQARPRPRVHFPEGPVYVA